MTEHELPPERDLPTTHHARRREHLVTEVTNVRRRFSRSARWFGGIGAAVLIAGGGSAAAIASQTDQIYNVACFSEAKLPPATDEYSHSISVFRSQNPVQECGRNWREGNVKSGTHKTPPLVACLHANIDDRRIVSVIPGEPGTCERLGLAPHPDFTSG